MKPKYKIVAVSVSGGWDDSRRCDRLRDAVETAYLVAARPEVRCCTISRLQRCGVYWNCAEVVGCNGRVFLAKPGALAELKWKGQLPTAAAAFRELTGKYEIPLTYHI